MSFISRLLGNNDEEFTEVRVDREVLESVIYYSKKSYPNEFWRSLTVKLRTRYSTSQD
jgi:hypothetical protein